MNTSWNLIKKHQTCTDWFTLDIFTHPRVLPKSTKSILLVPMVIAPALFATNKKHCLWDFQTLWKLLALRFSAPDVRKYTFLNSDRSTLMVPTLAHPSLRSFWSTTQTQSFFHLRFISMNQRYSVSMSMEKEAANSTKSPKGLLNILRIACNSSKRRRSMHRLRRLIPSRTWLRSRSKSRRTREI